MAGGIDWFRWHHGSVTDPKFQLVARKAGVRLGDVIAVWAFVLEKASADHDRGTIGELDFETLDYLLGADDGTAIRILDAMTARGLIAGNRIAKWEERQPKREREDDTAAERKRRQREREAADRQEPPNTATDGDVTPSHATSHQSPPRGEESREEENSSSSLRSEEGRASKSRSPRPSSAITLKTYLQQCREDGTKAVPDTHPVRAYCRDAGISDEMLQVAWCVFREDYTAGTKKDKRYKDWPGHFANAVRGCWAKLWYTDACEVKWTSRGLQEKTVLEARMKAKEEAHAPA